MNLNNKAYAKAALRTIKKYGSPGKVIKKGTPEDFGDLGVIEPATEDTEILGLITIALEYSNSQLSDEVLSTDTYVLWQSEEGQNEVEIGMVVVINSIEHGIISIGGLTSNDNVVIYEELQLRAGQ